MKNLYALALTCIRRSFLLILLLITLSSTAQESMRANLYVVVANVATLMDGNLTNYNNIYSNNVDINDAWKMTNPGINFGILRAATNLVVERRSIYSISDTTFFRMWNMTQNNYRIKFMLKNLNHTGMHGIIKDNYLNTETTIALNDTTYYDFTVDSNPASATEMRFQLIYGPDIAGSGPVDVNMTGIQAQRKGKDILVEWSVVNEISMESYIIEHAIDGRNFTQLQKMPALNGTLAKTYNYLDTKATAGTNFYRIKAISIGGKIQFSPIAKLSAIAPERDISVYPNPVTNKTVQLQFNNQAAGKFNLSILYSNGVQQQLPSVYVNEGQSNRSIMLPQSLAPGVYQLQFIGADNVRTIKAIQVL